MSAIRDRVSKTEREVIGLHGVLHQMQEILESRLQRIVNSIEMLDAAYEREIVQHQPTNGRREVAAKVEQLRKERTEVLLHFTRIEHEVRRAADLCAEANKRMRELPWRDYENLETEASGSS